MNPEVLDDKPARANVLGFHSGVTKRVCRSTLAAEASHLAEAVEAGDWGIAWWGCGFAKLAASHSAVETHVRHRCSISL